jgi:tripartite-type tricarboxylate transporter receptor subunit TctC
MSFRTTVLIAIVAIGAVTMVQSTRAQNYPAKPIHLIVPYPAGGGTDFFARLVGQKMSELIGQAIVVENKPGAARFARRMGGARSLREADRP